MATHVPIKHEAQMDLPFIPGVNRVSIEHGKLRKEAHPHAQQDHLCCCLTPLSADERKPALADPLQIYHLCLSLRCLSSCRCAGGPAGLTRLPISIHPCIGYSFLMWYLLSSSWTSCTLIQHPILVSQHGLHEQSHTAWNQGMRWFNHRNRINSWIITTCVSL